MHLIVVTQQIVVGFDKADLGIRHAEPIIEGL